MKPNDEMVSPHNASFHLNNIGLLSLEAIEAPVVVPSSDFDDRLAHTYERLGMRLGLLENVAGIKERRWWPEGITFQEVAAQAGEAAIQKSGIDRSRIGLVIDTSVCRDRLEPSAAVTVHHLLGLPSSCLNFDLANACLGFLNAIQVAGSMIDAGTIEYALIVDGEGSREVQENTLARLAGSDTTIDRLFEEFATLTLGSGAAAMVLGRADANPGSHVVRGGVARAATEHHDLFVGSLLRMRTDTAKLLDAGLELAEAAWAECDPSWREMDWYIIHQVSEVHTNELCKRLGIDMEQAPLTFPHFGNIGPASVPYTLAKTMPQIKPGERVLMLGIGSGINTSALEIVW